MKKKILKSEKSIGYDTKNANHFLDLRRVFIRTEKYMLKSITSRRILLEKQAKHQET